LLYLLGFSRIFLLRILVFKGLTARRLYKSFGIKWLWRQFVVVLLARSCLVSHDCLRNYFSVRHVGSRNPNAVLCAWRRVRYNCSPCQFLHYLNSTFRRFGSGKVQFRRVKWPNFNSARVAGHITGKKKLPVMHACWFFVVQSAHVFVTANYQ
jgi:hypothetical protein